jgi:hypothetical protein
LFDEPARAVPVSAKVRMMLRHDDEVPFAGLDEALTARAGVPLARGVGLDRSHGLGFHSESYGARIAHRTSPTVTPMVATTMTTSVRSVACRRNGLKPMRGW